MIDFNRYKHHLIDYLRIHGIECELGQVRSCPWHEDSKPSFSVFTGNDGYPAFNCFGCGRAGDIYNAVEFCEGETDRARQFEIIERRFGGGSRTFTPAPKPKQPAFTPDPDALEKLTAWLESNHKANEYIRGYFDQRALLKSGGKEYHYPTELFPELLSYFYWWPGRNAAERALGKSVLFAAGIPWNKDDEKEEMQKRRLAWYHAGILAKSPEGFKLFFIADGKSQQRNPRAGVSYFPIPGELPQGESVVLMEGEIDAVMCRAAGIPNTFSMGGKSGLTKDRIAKYIVPKKLDEIILFADNDADGGGQKKFGLLPITPQDHIRETVPDNLRKMGYDGAIRLTVLPDGCGFKDPDDAIRNGRADLVRQAIATAQDYIPPEKTTAETEKKPRLKLDVSNMTEWECVPVKFLRSFLNKIPYGDLRAEDATRAAIAAAKSCKKKELDAAAVVIANWSKNEIVESEIKELAKKDGTPFDLLDIGSRYGLSDYRLNRLKEILVPAAEIVDGIGHLNTILPIDYDALIETEAFRRFVKNCDHAFSSYALAEALKGKLLYIDHEESNYVFTGNYWTRIPSIATEAHAALVNALCAYLAKNPDQKKLVADCIKTLGSNSFRQKLANDLNKKEAQFYHDEKKQPILFDSYPVRETITLLDGVLDFSGDKIVFRKGKPEEYRLVPLPYTVRQIRQAAHPETFLRAIDLDFDEPSKETLEKNPQRTKDTFLYALSLIPSRNVAKNYVIFMTGTGGAGKSTIMTVINDVFGYENVAQLNAKVLISNKKNFDNENGPSPEIAELEGKMLAVTMEIPEDGKLNSDQLKRLTGGDLISARQLRQGLHKFRPTAQIAIVGNSLPAFYKHDSGIIRRLLVFHFNVEHAKRARSKEHKARYKGIPSDSAKLVEQIRAEAPGIIRLLAEKYIELKRDHDLNIPTSQECENAKSQYIEAQNKETDEFYEQCVKFTPGDDNAFIFATDMYHCYLNFKGYQEGSAEALKQKQFTFYLKKDHPELCGGNWCQRRRDGGKPEWGFKFVSFTDEGKEYLQPESASGLPFAPPPQPEMPLDDPFAAPPEYPPPTDEDGNEIDIY